MLSPSASMRANCLLAAATAAVAFAPRPRTPRRAASVAFAPRPRAPRRRVAARGKKAKKIDREAAWSEKKAREAAAALRRNGSATDLRPAAIVVDGRVVSEDHNHEQFFYDERTARRLERLVARFQKPLLVCNPSLAARVRSPRGYVCDEWRL